MSVNLRLKPLQGNCGVVIGRIEVERFVVEVGSASVLTLLYEVARRGKERLQATFLGRRPLANPLATMAVRLRRRICLSSGPLLSRNLGLRLAIGGFGLWIDATAPIWLSSSQRGDELTIHPDSAAFVQAA
jgi:hypothetical protein